VSIKPDLVECWVFRVGASGVEVLLIRRAAHRIFPGLWQCVTGGVEPGESVPGAALREVLEETGLGGGDIEAFYDLDHVAPFYDEGSDGVVVSAIFAVRVGLSVMPRLSHEHDAMRWMRAADVPAAVVWPSYAESVRRVAEVLTDPAREPWFRLDADGRRIARRPTS
jgi:8-oxo-dGTP pyrophosphatase MutT (NUDIX family)